MVQERFHRSGSTISRVFNKVLGAIIMLYPTIVTQPNGDIIPSRICNDPKMSQYFEDASAQQTVPTFTRTLQIPMQYDSVVVKERLVKCPGICTFDELFCYLLPGWEGASHDRG
jgi:hypothetical protein